MFLPLVILSSLFVTVQSQYASYYYPQYGYAQPAYYSRSPYGYNQYSSYGYPSYYQQYSSYRAPSLLGSLFGGGGYNVDQYGNKYIGSTSNGFFLTCNGKGCAVRG
ncbi:unnamed protein product [Haemonchus placei]|uniref:Uncharacterized protein n=1 Tax=Haemonchus placei TaxID=6290 RepID=A0A0N4W512_HAEPC|nr:unnamed protein product [Haemonchus placei]